MLGVRRGILKCASGHVSRDASAYLSERPGGGLASSSSSRDLFPVAKMGLFALSFSSRSCCSSSSSLSTLASRLFCRRRGWARVDNILQLATHDEKSSSVMQDRGWQLDSAVVTFASCPLLLTLSARGLFPILCPHVKTMLESMTTARGPHQERQSPTRT